MGGGKSRKLFRITIVEKNDDRGGRDGRYSTEAVYKLSYALIVGTSENLLFVFDGRCKQACTAGRVFLAVSRAKVFCAFVWNYTSIRCLLMRS